MSAPTTTRPAPTAGVSDATEVLQLRRRRSRRRLALRIGIGVLVLALLGAGTWVVGFSSLLTARTVTVTGTDVLSHGQVRRAAQVPLGTPLARVDLDAIADRVAALKPVADVTVERHWPHAVVVRVTERRPVLVVAQRGRYVWVDPSGVAFRTTDGNPRGLVPADISTADPGLVAAVASVAAALPSSTLRHVDHIVAPTAESITLVLTGSRTAIWGSATQSSTKAEVLDALLKADKNASVYDVSGPANPTTR